jgi:hypothetical protein
MLYSYVGNNIEISVSTAMNESRVCMCVTGDRRGGEGSEVSIRAATVSVGGLTRTQYRFHSHELTVKPFTCYLHYHSGQVFTH